MTNHLRKLWQNTIDPCPCRGHSTPPTPCVDSYQNADLCASFERPAAAGRIPASMHPTKTDRYASPSPKSHPSSALHRTTGPGNKAFPRLCDSPLGVVASHATYEKDFSGFCTPNATKDVIFLRPYRRRRPNRSD